jgi:hypothetical protein
MTGAVPASPGPDGPRSYTSSWLRAVVLDWREERDRQYENIRRTGGWTYGRAAVVDNAFWAAVRQHLAEDTKTTAVRDFTREALALRQPREADVPRARMEDPRSAR